MINQRLPKDYEILVRVIVPLRMFTYLWEADAKIDCALYAKVIRYSTYYNNRSIDNLLIIIY